MKEQESAECRAKWRILIIVVIVSKAKNRAGGKQCENLIPSEKLVEFQLRVAQPSSRREEKINYERMKMNNDDDDGGD